MEYRNPMNFSQIVSDTLIKVEDRALLIASPKPLTKFVIHSNRVHLRHTSDAEDVPDIERTGQGENQRTKEDGRSRPLKLTVLSVVEVGRGDFHKKEDGKDEVDYRKDYVVHHVLDLATGFLPSILNRTCNITCICGKRRHAEHGHKEQYHDTHKEKFRIVEFPWC